MAKLIWTDIASIRNGNKYCEAPRHKGQEIPSSWYMVIVGVTWEPEPTIKQAMCEECMGRITMEATGLTPTQGAYHLPDVELP